MQVPEIVRTQSPQFAYTPLVKIESNEFVYLIGERLVAIGCSGSYPGWGSFRSKILELVEILKGANLVSVVERYSLKYVDVLKRSLSTDIAEILKIELLAGNTKLTNNNAQISIEILREDIVAILQVSTNAIVQHPILGERRGTVVDVDTIWMIQSLPKVGLDVVAQHELDDLHDFNKSIFFDLLSDAGLKALRPIAATCRAYWCPITTTRHF